MTLVPARIVCLALLFAAPLPAAGCAYAGDRLLDMSDIVDLKLGTGIGIGVKAELTYYVGIGAGLGVNAYLREWYGRKSYETYGDRFVHVGVFGQDGGMDGPEKDAGVRARVETYVLLVNMTATADHVAGRGVLGYSDAWQMARNYEVPPLGTRWRVGGEVLIPAISFGLYLNLGELADFLLGFTTYDFREDDGLDKGARYRLGDAPTTESP